MTPSISYKNIYANSPRLPAVIPTHTQNPNSISSLYGLCKSDLTDIEINVCSYNRNKNNVLHRSR